MPDIPKVVADYAAAWLEHEEAERRRLLEACWSEDGEYKDPTAEVFGRDALLHHVEAFSLRQPGARLEVTSGVQHYGNCFHFTWVMAGPDGTALVEGRDFGEVDGDGRIRRIVGFFGPPPRRTG